MQKSLQTGIWLIGIGILALTDFWWPGIMFVIAVSTLVSGSIQAAIWLAGIGVLGLTNFWWPGILFLVGISMLAGGITRTASSELSEGPDSDIEIPPESLAGPDPEPEPNQVPVPAAPYPEPAGEPTRFTGEWLPETCPACGGPITARDAVWHSSERAACPYCNSILKPA